MSVTAEAAHLLAAEPRMSPEDAREFLSERNIRLPNMEAVRLAQSNAEVLRAHFERQFEQMFPRLEVQS